MKFLIVNGPNLNLLGQREPDIYGDKSYDALCALCRSYAADHGAQADCFQSNHEGAIIDAIQDAQGKYDAIIINPGAYTHYSYAIHDALKAITVPAYEVHLSDIQSREDFRKVSVTAPACVGQVYGLGFDGYLRAMDHFLPAAPQTAPAVSAPAARGEALCVIGDPVAHSKSPAIHNAIRAALGLPSVYTTRTVTLAELPAFVDEARTGGTLRGFNATMPHKQALIPLLDQVDEEARTIGAVNTVCIEDGKAVGHNTDGRGFLAALKSELGIDPFARMFTILGAGGAARSVAVALARAGACTVNVCNRNVRRANDLSMTFPAVLFPTDLEPETLYNLAGQTQILINCTSLGMTGQGDFDDLTFLSRLPRNAVVCDLVYEPAETTLLKEARRLGLATMGGLPMLIHQAILAQEHYLGRKLDDHAALAEAARQALAAE